MMQFFLKGSKFKNVIELRDAFFKEKAAIYETENSLAYSHKLPYQIWLNER